MNDTHNQSEDEVARLRARIKELEAELSREEEKAAEEGEKERNIADSVKDVSSQALGETRKIVRGLAYAYIEELSSAVLVMNSFVDDVFQRDPGKAEDSVTDRARSLHSDISSGVLKAIDECLDIPSKVIDSFYEAYKKECDTSE